MKFGVQLGFTNNIWIGNINKKGNQFLNKEDKTLEVVNAVVELIKRNDKKNLTTELNDGKRRYILTLKEIEIKDIEKEKFVDKFTYTSCEDCVNKDEDVYLEVCGNCRHFYGCYFEKKEIL